MHMISLGEMIELDAILHLTRAYVVSICETTASISGMQIIPIEK